MIKLTTNSIDWNNLNEVEILLNTIKLIKLDLIKRISASKSDDANRLFDVKTLDELNNLVHVSDMLLARESCGPIEFFESKNYPTESDANTSSDSVVVEKSVHNTKKLGRRSKSMSSMSSLTAPSRQFLGTQITSPPLLAISKNAQLTKKKTTQDTAVPSNSTGNKNNSFKTSNIASSNANSQVSMRSSNVKVILANLPSMVEESDEELCHINSMNYINSQLAPNSVLGSNTKYGTTNNNSAVNGGLRSQSGNIIDT